MEGNSVQAIIARMRTTFFERSEMFDQSRPWYVDVSDMSWNAGGGRVKASAAGLFIVDAGPKPVFTVISSNSTVNSEALTVGDVMIGDNTTGGSARPNILFDQSAGTLKFRTGTTTVLTLDPTNGLVITATSAFAATRALNFYDGSERVGSVYANTDSSTYNACRVEAYSTVTARNATAYVFAAHEDDGVADALIYATQIDAPDDIDPPTASVWVQSDYPNDQAFVQLSLDTVAGGTTTFLLDKTGTTVTNGIKAFKIDHPVDPDNKWLVHAAVESDHNATCYEGSVTLDDTGAAVVQLPAWFSALNGPNSIQLTAHGVAMPGLHVAQDVDAANTFAIAGGVAGQRVDWFIQSRRRDPWARDNQMVVEPDKKDSERGLVAAWREYGRTREDGLLEKQAEARERKRRTGNDADKRDKPG